MNGRHRMSAPAGVIFGILFVLFGLVNLYLNLTCLYENSQFIGHADKIVAECTGAGDGTNSSNSYLKSTVAFFYNGKRYENVVIDNYGQCILPNHDVEIYVNPDNPLQCQIEYKFTEGTGQTYCIFSILAPIGVIMIVVGIARIKQGNIW